MEGFLIRGWNLNLPMSGATSTLAGGATLDQGDPCLRAQVVGVNFRGMEGFVIRG